jgi:hypothetical protein
MLAPSPTPELEDHPLSVVRDCIHNTVELQIRTLVNRIANYPDRLGLSDEFVKNSTEQNCFEITGFWIKYSAVLWFYLFMYLCIYLFIYFIFLLWRCDPTRVMDSSFLRFLDHTQRNTTVGRTPLDE